MIPKNDEGFESVKDDVHGYKDGLMIKFWFWELSSFLCTTITFAIESSNCVFVTKCLPVSEFLNVLRLAFCGWSRSRFALFNRCICWYQ